MSKSDNLLRLEHVSKNFDLKGCGEVNAVRDVSLTVKSGEIVGIVGESGCGKSTLARLITCIEPVTCGQIFFDVREISSFRGKELRAYRKQVQMIFQDPSNVFSPRMKIGTFLMEPWRNFEHTSRPEAMRLAVEALKNVNLDEDYLKKYPHQLSGGELQRISIARAVALHPKLLICDEATSALDVSTQSQIINLLKDNHKKSEYSILMISHDLALAENFCDRIAVMYLGSIVEILPGRGLRKNARHPYTKALLDSVFSVHGDPEKKIRILTGEPPSPVNVPAGCAFCGRCPYGDSKCERETPQLKNIDFQHQVACHKEELPR